MIANALPLSLINNPLLSQWIAFEQPGRVRVGTGRVEIGQGVLTALTQIAAEELDLEVDQVRLISGQTDVSPGEGWTSGSYSMSVGGRSLQIVCAEVRALFVACVARKLNCPEAEIGVAKGRFTRSGQETGHDYWSVAGDVPLERDVVGNAPLKRPADYRIVGANLPRLDLPAKILGAGFVHDLVPPGCLHARILRQPWWDANLVELDEDAVRRAAGAPVDILRVGNFVGCLSESEFVAARAVEAARAKARWSGGRKVPDDIGHVSWLRTQPTTDNVVERVSGDEISAGEPVTAVFWRPFTSYASIGPSCGLAEFTDGKLTVWSHSQGPIVQREWLAKALRLDPANVTVLHRHGAGAYGMNTADDAAFDAAFIATRVPGRPVRVMWNREDEFKSAPMSPAMLVELNVVLGPDGKPSDWVCEIWSPPHTGRPGMNGDCNMLGAYALPDTPPLHPRQDVPESSGGGATRGAQPLYDLPRYRLVHHMIPDLALRTASLRGLGYWTNVYANESLVDELAELAGEDPVTYRLSIMSEPRARRVIEAAARLSGWFDMPDGDGATAKGIAFARYKNIAAYCAVVAEVAVDEEVRLKRFWCAADAGLVINPDGARNQLEGGIIHGASFALRESIRFEDGQVATSNFIDYPILRFSDVPEVEIELVEAVHELPLGLGEAAVGPAAAAIGNAVSRALGARLRTLPLTREGIMSALLNGG